MPPFSQREQNLAEWRARHGCVCDDNQPSIDCAVEKHRASARRRAEWKAQQRDGGGG